MRRESSAEVMPPSVGSKARFAGKDPLKAVRLVEPGPAGFARREKKITEVADGGLGVGKSGIIRKAAFGMK